MFLINIDISQEIIKLSDNRYDRKYIIIKDHFLMSRTFQIYRILQKEPSLRYCFVVRKAYAGLLRIIWSCPRGLD